MAPTPILVERALGLGGRGAQLVQVSIAMSAVALLLVLNRLYFRITLGKTFGADDYAIAASMVFAIALSVTNIVAVDHGYGRYSTRIPEHHLTLALKMFWVNQIVYKFSINLTKMSIVLLYLRIFVTERFRTICVYVFIYVTLYGIASIVATILECQPIARVYDDSVEGTCINLTAFWYANAISNILTDLIILILPMGVISTLRLPARSKYGLMGVFALGAFVCATSIMRMTTLDMSSKALDRTHGTLSSTVWTTVETNTAIICACLPMLRTPMAMMFPSWFPPTPYGDDQNLSQADAEEMKETTTTTNTAENTDGKVMISNNSSSNECSSTGRVTGNTSATEFYDPNPSNRQGISMISEFEVHHERGDSSTDTYRRL